MNSFRTAQLPAPNKGKKHLTLEEKGKILQLRGGGAPYKAIGRILGKDHKSISTFYHHWEKTGELVKEEKRGRKRKTCERDDQRIVMEAKRDPRISAKDIQALPGMPKLCLNTIRSRIAETNELKSYNAAKKSLLLSKQSQAIGAKSN